MTSEEGRIVVAGLTKTYGTLRAVDGLNFTVEPGTITGFLVLRR
jgi:ABC-2 type transport system ATP-binding protein